MTLGTRCTTRCTIVPPYLLENLARSGVLPAGIAEETLSLDRAVRERRSRRGPQAEPVAGPDARWVVHDAENGTDLPGRPVRTEGVPATGDVSVDEAAEGIAWTLDVFRDELGRVSYDGAGATVSLTVHYGDRYANAFWDGTQLVFGDGDGEVFGRFTGALDVLAHEFGHAVTERTAGLVYQGQSGALNESMSDVFGAIVKQARLGQDAASADWLIGAGIFLEGVDARGLRDMAAPGTAYDDPALGKDPQPAHMDDYIETTDDNGGVHLNSGIPNRAFVLAARAIGGTSAAGAGRIWYATLTGGALAPDVDFATFAAATVEAAGDQAAAVRSAWEQVGVVPGGGRAPGSPTPAPEGLPTDPAPVGAVSVRRSGGLAGQVREGSVDLASDDARAGRLRELLARSPLRSAAGGASYPDGFVYTFRTPEGEVSVPEQHLSDDLALIVRLVLDEEG